MAGKSGRSINNVPESPVKKMIFSWEGILVLLFIAVNIFCAMFSEYYNMSSLLRQMPVYLAEVFMMLPMAYILVLGEIDISVGAIVCLSATMSCIVCNTNAPFIVVVITALGVGTICGAINGFILTKFQELPPMIVTLATQIIFRGISEIVLGSGGSISASNTDGFRAIGGKVGDVPYILFLVVILSVIFAVILRQEHIRTSCICNRYKPSDSILFRCSCTEDPFHHLHHHGYSFRTVCTVPGFFFIRCKHNNR